MAGGAEHPGLHRHQERGGGGGGGDWEEHVVEVAGDQGAINSLKDNQSISHQEE